MPGTVVLGAQWGDEAKAKVVDYLADDAAAVVRYQGGANAGHTVVIDDEKFVFHLLPSGVLRSHSLAIIANGVMVDLVTLCTELDELLARGAIQEENLLLSENAHVVMPYHKVLDEARERAKGRDAVGTTKRGIGPVHADKYGRIGIRVIDLLNPAVLRRKIERALQEKNVLFRNLYRLPPMEPDAIIADLQPAIERVRPFITNTSLRIQQLLDADEHVLFEGAQGTMLDVEHGTYPYCTSSHTVAGAASVGAGIGPQYLTRRIGVVKAYVTRVGNGPMPTELDDRTGAYLAEVGQEIGSTTGRQRRCGWFDGLVAKHVSRVNGLTEAIVTKLDVLDDLDQIKICVAYEYRGERLEHLPTQSEILAECTPMYETFPGWKQPTVNIRAAEDLPPNAWRFLEALQGFLGCPISHVGVGPERTQIIPVVSPALAG